MTKEEKLLAIAKAINDKKIKSNGIKNKYIKKNNVKKLTDSERIDRIEELLNII